MTTLYQVLQREIKCLTRGSGPHFLRVSAGEIVDGGPRGLGELSHHARPPGDGDEGLVVDRGLLGAPLLHGDGPKVVLQRVSQGGTVLLVYQDLQQFSAYWMMRHQITRP